MLIVVAIDRISIIPWWCVGCTRLFTFWIIDRLVIFRGDSWSWFISFLIWWGLKFFLWICNLMFLCIWINIYLRYRFLGTCQNLLNWLLTLKFLAPFFILALIGCSANFSIGLFSHLHRRRACYDTKASFIIIVVLIRFHTVKWIEKFFLFVSFFLLKHARLSLYSRLCLTHLVLPRLIV